MAIQGFSYKDVFHVSFTPETEESDIYDHLLVTVDNVTYECASSQITTIWANADGTPQTVLYRVESENSGVSDKRGIALIVDEIGQSVTFCDEDGNVRNGAIFIEKDSQNGQITSIWGNVHECDILVKRCETPEYAFTDILSNMENSDDLADMARYQAISDNLDKLI